MGYNKPNPLKMMESALKMYKAEKKGGMHRMESPMYATEASRELKYMPIDDRASNDRIPDSGNLKQENKRIADSGSIEGTSGPSESKPSRTREPHKKGSPAKNMDHKGMSKKELHQHGMKEHPAKPPGSPAKAAKPDYIDIDKDGNTTESMKDAAKAKGSPAKMHHKKSSPAKNMNKGYGQEVKSPMKRQGYNDKLDESLAKDGKESSKKQSMKDRRDESKGMEKSKGKGAYSSDPKMS